MDAIATASLRGGDVVHVRARPVVSAGTPNAHAELLADNFADENSVVGLSCRPERLGG